MPVTNRTVLRSMSDAISYCRKMLGEPIINIEVHDWHIEQCVVDAVQLFQRHMHGEGAYTDTVVFTFKAGQRTYPMPDNVIEAVKFEGSYGGDINRLFTADHQILMESGVLPSITRGAGSTSGGMDLSGYDIATKYLELYRDFFTKEFVVQYNFLRREMVIEPTPTCDVVGVLHLWKAERIENCVNHHMVKDLMVAKVKQVWGGILGKYTIQLPGGGSVDGNTLKQEGRDDQQRIVEQMEDEGSNALDFYVG